MGKWTPELILREILRRESAGRPLDSGGDDGVSHALYAAGARMFGSWPNAVRAAGISPKRAQVKTLWSPAKILAAIRSLSRRRRRFLPGEIREQHSSLCQAARKYFGSWGKAVVAAGVDPLKLRRAPPWTKDRVIESILTRALKNEPLGGRAVRPRSLADAGANLFGTWGSAIAAAGLDPGQYVRGWENDGCTPINHRETAEQPRSGHSENSERRETDAGTEDRLHKMGLTAPALHKPGRCWTNHEVINAILARAREGKRMNAAAVSNDNRALYAAATRRFGNWATALITAGVIPREFPFRSEGMSS